MSDVDTSIEFDAELGAGTFEASENAIKAELEKKQKIAREKRRQRFKNSPLKFAFQDVALPWMWKAAKVGVPAFYLATLIQGAGYINEINYSSLAIASALALPILESASWAGEKLGHLRGHATNAASFGRFQEVDDRAEARGFISGIAYGGLVVSPAVGIDKVGSVVTQIGVDVANVTADFMKALYVGYGQLGQHSSLMIDNIEPAAKASASALGLG